MKISLIILLSVCSLLMACEQHITTETVVHEDGSLDKAITLSDVDSVEILKKNVFNARPATGWRVTFISDERKKVPDDTADTTKARVINDEKIMARFTKHFTSAEEANKMMNAGTDSLFEIESRVETKFRWFYTYMRYSDTYKAINRLTKIPLSDYLTQEDYAFIKRLPGEGQIISKADSIYLYQLNDKIYELYGIHAIFEEYFQKIRQLVQQEQGEKHLVDSLDRNKKAWYKRIARERDIDDTIMLQWVDSSGIALSTGARAEYTRWIKQQERKFGLATFAGIGKYVHRIEMPAAITTTNADSIAGKSVFWKPPVIKFLVTDYTMYAESRKLNYWVVILSAVIVMGGGILVFRRRKAS